MQYKITKKTFEALEEDARKEYILDGDEAILKIEGEGAPTLAAMAELEKKRQLEIEHRKAAEKKVKEADDRAAQLQKDLESAGNNKEEIAKLTKRHQEELDSLRKEREEHDAKVKGQRDAAMIKEAAEKLSDRFTTPGLISNEIAKRLVVEEKDGEAVVRVLTTEGKASATSLAELQKEFLDNPDYKSIVKAKVGSGGGASQSQGGGATDKPFKEMTATEQAIFANEHPEEYAAAVKDLGGS